MARINEEQNYTTHLAALINLVGDEPNPIDSQVPLFMMTEQEVKDFEEYIRTTNDLDGGFETKITFE